ncbi:hypothetical protein DICPUDRAFT_149285 [Dictyostelium purpureum]|uniref:Uncharacterized protein n=1 Tax=Dictyostelium purpureum TaxID=5786 RepID=F0ZDA7_DICPU|nr:uncharacterized protein DICPUDRAFT_149285 [Dictyostelium purpureum]EGC38104.1 hypothetical protein DICPUDRAFT_149285 [Dictyostelium purpureum]|eukprot:XP_003285411.1 hypothetical protein DICPUDRAFT_149285 [Dictyostelium purpureum]
MFGTKTVIDKVTMQTPNGGHVTYQRKVRVSTEKDVPKLELPKQFLPSFSSSSRRIKYKEEKEQEEKDQKKPKDKKNKK